ncbi:uncharacterized protein LOC144109714 [Amblyomma americanum]
MSTTVVTEAPGAALERWDRTGEETLTEEQDEALLSGWHEVIRWFLGFLLSSPQEAMFLRLLNKTDMIEAMDLYLQYEPQAFLVAVLGLVYIVAGVLGSVAYVHLRRRKQCGGDRTQDINENLRCVLQVYTAAYIVVLAAILLGSLLMLASLFELGQTVATHEASFQASLMDIQYYIRNASAEQAANNRRRRKVLGALSKLLEEELENSYTAYAAPLVKSATSGAAATGLLIAAEQPPSGLLAAPDDPVQPNNTGVTPEEFMARYMAQRMAAVYNHTLTECLRLAAETTELASDFSRMLLQDAEHTVVGFEGFAAAIDAVDSIGVLKTLRSQRKSYLAAIVGSFSVLFCLYAGSFIMGMFYYNEGVAPTKRSASSNYAGLAMLLAVVLSFPACSLLMLVTLAVMVVALTLTNYICRPFENIIYDTADVTQISLLDDTMRVIWPREKRGKWFGRFLAGTTLTVCNGGRLFEVIQGDYVDSVRTLLKLTDTIRHLLLSLTVDPRLIFTEEHPEQPFFAQMSAKLWDHVDKITEMFFLDKLKDLNELDRGGDLGNPPCFAAYKGYERALGLLCRGIIRNVNAFWTALGFCLWMFLVLGMVSHFLSKYFLRMVNWTYDGSEVESYSRQALHSTLCTAPRAVELSPQ